MRFKTRQALEAWRDDPIHRCVWSRAAELYELLDPGLRDLPPEWELIGAGFTDHHPHDEVSLVLAGELHIEVDGVEAVGRAGDTIRVPASSTGRYWAPKYARMYGVYGPNPDGAESQYLEYWEIDD